MLMNTQVPSSVTMRYTSPPHPRVFGDPALTLVCVFQLQKALAAAAGARKKEEIATNHACELGRALRHYEESGVGFLRCLYI